MRRQLLRQQRGRTEFAAVSSVSHCIGIGRRFESAQQKQPQPGHRIPAGSISVS